MVGDNSGSMPQRLPGHLGFRLASERRHGAAGELVAIVAAGLIGFLAADLRLTMRTE